MLKVVVIWLFALGAFAFEHTDIQPITTGFECEVVDLRHEQLVCNHRYNIDAERTSTVVVPSVRTSVTPSTRYQQNRTLSYAVAGRSITTSNYLVTRFIHRLGSLPRAVDFYLYMLCQLRL